MRVYSFRGLHSGWHTLEHVSDKNQTQSLHGKLLEGFNQGCNLMYCAQAIMMVIWATVSAVTALSTNFTGLLLTRFFLGATEAPFYPGAVYIISSFYTRKEIATRIAILYTGNIAATAFAGLIAAGVFHGMDDLAGIAGWQWLFILQGLITAVIGVMGWFFLPNYPRDTWWLTPEERELAYNRVELDTTDNKGETSVWKGLSQAVKDPMVWLFALMAHFQYMHPLSLGESRANHHTSLAANGFKNFVSHSHLMYL